MTGTPGTQGIAKISGGSVMRRRVVGDLGGGTWRKANAAVVSGVARLSIAPKVAVNFNSVSELYDFCFQSLIEYDFEGVEAVVLSIAGPVDSKSGVILKLTNHGVEGKDIPLGPELSTRLSAHFGKTIKVYLINDGDAGAWAEFSPQGALGKVTEGSLGMALIIGNGVGGGLKRRTSTGIESVPGAAELGHWLISFPEVEKIGLGILGDRIECGCGTVGERVAGTSVCLEALTKGPALAEAFRVALGWPTETLSPVNERVAQMLVAGKGLPRPALFVLCAEAELLVRRMEALQRGFDNEGPINVALIGGVGCGLGQWLVPLMVKASEKMGELSQRPSWGKTPVYHVGAFPSDQTNLVGDASCVIG
jgi:hypothetical protein